MEQDQTFYPQSWYNCPTTPEHQWMRDSPPPALPTLELQKSGMLMVGLSGSRAELPGLSGKEQQEAMHLETGVAHQLDLMGAGVRSWPAFLIREGVMMSGRLSQRNGAEKTLSPQPHPRQPGRVRMGRKEGGCFWIWGERRPNSGKETRTESVTTI